MKISITSFTARGTRLCCQLAGRLNSGADECTAFVPGRFLDTYCGAGDVEGRIRCRDMSLSQWTGTMFREQIQVYQYIHHTEIPADMPCPGFHDHVQHMAAQLK